MTHKEAIDRAKAAEEQLAECLEHEALTHELIGNIVGHETSLVDGISQMRDRCVIRGRVLASVLKWAEAQEGTYHGNPLPPDMAIEIADVLAVADYG